MFLGERVKVFKIASTAVLFAFLVQFLFPNITNAEAMLPSPTWDYESGTGSSGGADYRIFLGSTLRLDIVDPNVYPRTGPSSLISASADFNTSVYLDAFSLEKFDSGSSGLSDQVASAGLSIWWQNGPSGNDYEQFGIYRGYLNTGSEFLDGYAVTHNDELSGESSLLAYAASKTMGQLSIVRLGTSLQFLLDGVLLYTADSVSFENDIHVWLSAQSNDAYGVIADFSSLDVSVRSTPTPIPGSALLFGSGLLGMIGIGRRCFS